MLEVYRDREQSPSCENSALCVKPFGTLQDEKELCLVIAILARHGPLDRHSCFTISVEVNGPCLALDTHCPVGVRVQLSRALVARASQRLSLAMSDAMMEARV